MGIRVKVLISIFLCSLLYSIYYWVLPLCIKPDKLEPIISSFIEKKYGYKITYNGAKFKMGLTPTVWISAESLKILNNDKTEALKIEKPILEVEILPFIIGHTNIKYLSLDDFQANFSYDKNLHLYLGQYKLNNDINPKIDINKAKINVDKFKLSLKNREGNKTTFLKGDFLVLDKFVKNKNIKVSSNMEIISDAHISTANFSIDTPLPLFKDIKNHPPEFNVSVTNLNLDKLSDIIAIFTNKEISSIAGQVNFEAHSGKIILEQKHYSSSLIVDNFKINSKYLQKPYSYPHKLELKANFLTENKDLSIPSISLKSPKFNVKLSGVINKISSKTPVPDFNLKMFNVRSEDLLELLPYGDSLFQKVALSPSYAKSAGFYSDVNVDLNIKNNFDEPDLFGKILIDDAYVIERIKKAPKGAFIGLNFKGKSVDLDVNVPTDINQHVNVTGNIELYRDRDVDLHITSTDRIDLSVAERVLMPVHKTLQFELGPVPVMAFSGYGNIDLVVKGNKKNPHTFGNFTTINASTNFDDIPNFILTNANSTLIFDDFNTVFKLQKGLVNNKPVVIEGTCDLKGRFNFIFKALNQPLNSLIIVAKTSPMISDLKNLLAPVSSASGNSNISMKIKGELMNIEDLKIGENVNFNGEIDLLSNNIKVVNISKTIKNITGKIKFNDFNANFDLNTYINSAKINIIGVIKNEVANIKVVTDKIKISDLINNFDFRTIKNVNSKEKNNSYVSLNASYKGSLNKIDYNNIDAKGQLYFKDLNLLYKPMNLPIKIISGSANINGNSLNINKINMQLASMPAILDGKIVNILTKPTFNAYFSAKLNQKFLDCIYNKHEIYPIKVKGDVDLFTQLSGAVANANIKSVIKIAKGANLYYMGASMGDENTPIHLSVNSNATKNAIIIKSFLYDKILNSQNNRPIISRQLATSGDLIYTKKMMQFKNFRIKTYMPTDTRIFNIVFKKPFIKKGHFTSDVYINGLISNPKVRGDFSLIGMDIPFYDTMINDITMKFLPTSIQSEINGEFLTNKFSLNANTVNKFTPPYIINNSMLTVGDFNINAIIDSFNKHELDANNSDAMKNVKSIPLHHIVINNLDIKADNVHVDKIDAKNLKAKVKFKNNVLDIQKFNFILAHGEMNGAINHNLKSKYSKISLNVSGANANNLLASLFELDGQIYGDLDGTMNFSCIGKNQNICLKTLNGYSTFQVKNGRMPKLGSLEYLLKAGNLIKSGITGLSLNGLIDLVTPLKTGNFDSIKGVIAVNNGIADKIQIMSSSRDLSLFITGIYNMSTYNADMYVFGRLSKKIANKLGPVGNASLNTLFSTIPGINLNSTKDTSILNDINKIPGIELSNKLYRIFAVEVHGDISGDDYVDSFRWVE